jgi:hypothetical protein
MIGIRWEDSWNRSVKEIRESYAILPYETPHPANLIELGAAEA